MRGEVVLEENNLAVTKGTGLLTVLAQIPAELYSLKVQVDNRIETQKLVKY